MFCGGVTVFSPLERFGAGTTSKDVGVIGVGGLGHFAIQFAAAMGARVTAISRGDNKKEDAMKLGASKYFATGGNLSEAVKGHARTLDLVICTISESPDAHRSVSLALTLTEISRYFSPRPRRAPGRRLLASAQAQRDLCHRRGRPEAHDGSRLPFDHG